MHSRDPSALIGGVILWAISGCGGDIAVEGSRAASEVTALDGAPLKSWQDPSADGGNVNAAPGILIDAGTSAAVADAAPPPAALPVEACGPAPNFKLVDGVCTPSCGAAGGNYCSQSASGAFECLRRGREMPAEHPFLLYPSLSNVLLQAHDCKVCCAIDPVPPRALKVCLYDDTSWDYVQCARITTEEECKRRGHNAGDPLYRRCFWMGAACTPSGWFVCQRTRKRRRYPRGAWVSAALDPYARSAVMRSSLCGPPLLRVLCDRLS
jgi:hypothetical protein